MSVNIDASGRAEISKMLASTAGILLAGTFTFSLFAIEKSEPTVWFWIALSLCVIFIVASIFACGMGMDSDSGPWYNRQAIFLAVGLLSFVALLPLSISAMAKDADAAAAVEQARQLAEYEARVDMLDARITSLVAGVECRKEAVAPAEAPSQ